MSELWPVYKGESFNIWEPDTGAYYDSADAESISRHLHAKRLRQSRTKSSAFHELEVDTINGPTTLPCLHPRIAFRDVTRSTDTRTMVAALIPGRRLLVNTAPYLLQLEGDESDAAYVLGVLSSMALDWQARRTVELHMTFAQIAQLSIPDAGPVDPTRVRVVQISAWLASCDRRLADWARSACPTMPPDPPRYTQRADLLAELDACVAYLYGFDECDLRVIFDTFGRPGLWDSRRDRSIEWYRRIVAARGLR